MITRITKMMVTRMKGSSTEIIILEILLCIPVVIISPFLELEKISHSRTASIGNDRHQLPELYNGNN